MPATTTAKRSAKTAGSGARKAVTRPVGATKTAAKKTDASTRERAKVRDAVVDAERELEARQAELDEAAAARDDAAITERDAADRVGRLKAEWDDAREAHAAAEKAAKETRMHERDARTALGRAERALDRARATADTIDER